MPRTPSRTLPPIGAGPQPAYRQVRNLIADQIRSGEIPQGSQLPAERLLAEQLNVSRVTLRRALAALFEDGLLTPSHGRGWYAVPPPLSEPPNALMSFTDLARSIGAQTHTQVLFSGVVKASSDEARRLGVRAGARLFRLERLRFLDDFPMAITTSWIPLARVPGIEQRDFADDSLYAVMRDRFDILATKADFEVEARVADDEDARVLDIPVGAPLLVATQTTQDQRGDVFELSQMVYRADSYRFRATLMAGQAGSDDVGLVLRRA
ncbi:MAG: GntR family transcriptional regulator [Nocardioidaceae bacterium]